MSVSMGSLFVDTVRDPRKAAEAVLRLRLDTNEVYMGVAIYAALGAILNYLFVTYALAPLVTAQQNIVVEAPPPIMSFVLAAGQMIVFANLVTWAGRALGGTGQLHDLVKLIAWEQFVLLVLVSVGFLLMMLVPLMGSLFVLIVFVLYLRILLHFIQTGHRLPTMAAAGAVLLISVVGIMLAMGLLATLLGAGSVGVS